MVPDPVTATTAPAHVASMVRATRGTWVPIATGRGAERANPGGDRPGRGMVVRILEPLPHDLEQAHARGHGDIQALHARSGGTRHRQRHQLVAVFAREPAQSLAL